MSECDSRSTASTVERAYRTQLAKGEVGLEAKKPVPRFSAAMKDFLNWSKHEHAARPSTHRRYEISSKALLCYFNETPIDQIKPEHVEQFKLGRIKQKKSAPAKKVKKLGVAVKTDKA